MSAAVQSYFSHLTAETGACWNRFWFTPTDRTPLDRLRIVVGLVSLYLLASLLPDLGFYFGENGVLPVQTVNDVSFSEFAGNLRGWSYLDYFTAPSELLALQIVGIVVVGLFTFGVFTPLTSALSLVVMLSTVNRAPMLTTLVEPVVTMALFYLCLGPAGPIAGIAARILDRPIPLVSSWATVAVRLVQVHLAGLYLAMGLSKLLSETWWNGTGAWWLMARTESRLFDVSGIAELMIGTTPIGLLIVNAWTHVVVIFELTFAVLIWNRMVRPLLLGWSVIHWIGIGVLLGQPLLALTMIGVNVAFIENGQKHEGTPS